MPQHGLVPRLASPAPRTQYCGLFLHPSGLSPTSGGLLQGRKWSGRFLQEEALAGTVPSGFAEVSIARRRDPWKALSGRLSTQGSNPAPVLLPTGS